MLHRINNLGLQLRGAWYSLRGYLGAEHWRRAEPIANRQMLRSFLESRSSFVAQTSLYGYLRTRAGMRYPQLFANDEFVKAIDIAKWQMWLACLSDLSVYAGGLIAHRSGAERSRVTSLLQATIGATLNASEGGRDEARAQRLYARIALIDWATVADDASPFSESPRTLIECAPVLEQLKLLDEEIVCNSVRFRWQEVRRELRRDLDANALMASEALRP